jgi:hypothetical protein
MDPAFREQKTEDRTQIIRPFQEQNTFEYILNSLSPEERLQYQQFQEKLKQLQETLNKAKGLTVKGRDTEIWKYRVESAELIVQRADYAFKPPSWLREWLSKDAEGNWLSQIFQKIRSAVIKFLVDRLAPQHMPLTHCSEASREKLLNDMTGSQKGLQNLIDRQPPQPVETPKPKPKFVITAEPATPSTKPTPSKPLTFKQLLTDLKALEEELAETLMEIQLEQLKPQYHDLDKALPIIAENRKIKTALLEKQGKLRDDQQLLKALIKVLEENQDKYSLQAQQQCVISLTHKPIKDGGASVTAKIKAGSAIITELFSESDGYKLPKGWEAHFKKQLNESSVHEVVASVMNPVVGTPREGLVHTLVR